MGEVRLPSGLTHVDATVSRRQFLITTGLALLGTAFGAHRLGDLMTDLLPLLNRVSFGAYAAKEPWPDVSAHYELEQQLGARIPTMSWFQSWTNGWLAPQSAAAAASGHALQIALAPAYDDGRGVPFAEILAGTWDRRLDLYFAGAAAHPHPVTIRMAHEMNLSQHHWSIANAAPCTASLDVWLDTWRYVVDRQRAIGGDVHWQWCVNSMDMGGISAESYWPGADYVDVMSIDVYNGYGPWTPGWKLIKPMYDRIALLHPTAPIWVAEIGCRPVTAGEPWSKAQWFRDLFALVEFPRLTQIIFFHMLKEYDWRITTSDVKDTMTTLLANASLYR